MMPKIMAHLHRVDGDPMDREKGREGNKTAIIDRRISRTRAERILAFRVPAIPKSHERPTQNGEIVPFPARPGATQNSFYVSVSTPEMRDVYRISFRFEGMFVNIAVTIRTLASRWQKAGPTPKFAS